MKKMVLSVFFALLGAAILQPVVLSAAEVVMWGSTTCKKRFLEPGKAALKGATGVEIRVLGVGTGQGMVGLLEGKTAVAVSSNTLKESIELAQAVQKEAGKPSLAVPDNLQYHMITEDIIVPIVHRNNPVSNLTWEQLAALNSGKITNWLDVGGPDMPVQVVTSHAGSSTAAVFQKAVMQGAPYAAGTVVVTSTPFEVEFVSTHEGAIGAISQGTFSLDPELTKVITTSPIRRPLGLITIGNPTPDVRKVIDFFLSDEGRVYREWTTWRYPMGR
jgi:phosphate transport system substrate-binding protein